MTSSPIVLLGATKVMIMLDEHTYPSESLLDSKMTPLQGPSLIVANDAMFTEADFKSKYYTKHVHEHNSIFFLSLNLDL